MKYINELNKKYGDKLISFNVPIIGVFSLNKRKKVGETTSCLRNYFIEQGFSVKVISCCRKQQNVDSCCFPYSIFSGIEEDRLQILSLNHFIYDLCKLSHVDLCIIEIPEGIIPISKEINNNFGVLAYKISAAINIDVGFLDIYADMCVDKIFEKFINIFRYRLSIEKVFFVMKKEFIDWSSIKSDKVFKVMNISNEKFSNVLQNIEQYNDLCIYNDKTLKKILDEIIAELSENAVVDAL